MSQKPPTMADELRELIREARAALKDLRAERREIERYMQTAAQERVAAAVGQAVAKGLKAYEAVIREAMDKAVAKVGKEFRKLENLYLTGDERGRGDHLGDLARRRSRGA